VDTSMNKMSLETVDTSMNEMSLVSVDTSMNEKSSNCSLSCKLR
jgi:hypothetical protein